MTASPRLLEEPPAHSVSAAAARTRALLAAGSPGVAPKAALAKREEATAAPRAAARAAATQERRGTGTVAIRVPRAPGVVRSRSCPAPRAYRASAVTGSAWTCASTLKTAVRAARDARARRVTIRRAPTRAPSGSSTAIKTSSTAVRSTPRSIRKTAAIARLDVGFRSAASTENACAHRTLPTATA